MTAVETEDPLYRKLADQDYLGRTLRISISTNSTEWSTSSDYVMGPEELTGESIRDLVYQRNRKISEMLNLKLSWVRTDLYFDGVAPYVRKMVSSGDDAVDLIINDQYGLIEVMQEGMLLNVYDLIRDSFDFSADGWYNDFMDQLSVGSSRRFLLAGDAFIDILRGTHALYFSTAILDNLYGDREIIYKAVDDDSWTIEKMTAMIEESYDDLDGNGRPSAGDRFGIFMNHAHCMLFYYASDSHIVSWDENGLPYVDIDMEKNTALTDRMVTIAKTRANYYRVDGSADVRQLVAEEKCLFSFWLKIADLESPIFRGYEDLGLAPYPKCGESQENYHSLSHDTVEIGAFPATVAADTAEAASAFLQAITLQSAKELMPTYYQTALQTKYARDAWTPVMLDVIRGTIDSPFEYAFNNVLNAIVNTPFQKSADRGTNLYASYVAQLLDGAELGLGEMLRRLDELS